MFIKVLQTILRVGALLIQSVNADATNSVVSFIEFEDGQSAFNNGVELRNSTAGSNHILFIFNVVNNKALADARANRLAASLSYGSSVFVGYRVSQRSEEANLVAVHTFNDLDSLEKAMIESNTNVYARGLNGAFSESVLRQWRHEVDNEIVVLQEYQKPSLQLKELVERVGWSLLDEKGEIAALKVPAFGLRLEIVSVMNSSATYSEMADIVGKWADTYPQIKANVDFELIDKDLKVVVRGKERVEVK